MSALKRIFGRDTKFYDLLESSAAESKAGIEILRRLIPQFATTAPDEIIGDLAQSRRKHKRISQETTEQLCRNFVTPLEREDIEALSSALYKISKTVEKIGERLTIAPAAADFSVIEKQLQMLEQAASVVAEMVNQIRVKSHGEGIKDTYERLQGIEGDADKLMNNLLRDLYHGGVDARVIVYWKDLFELFEKAIDRCRDAGYVVFHVALKYS